MASYPWSYRSGGWLGFGIPGRPDFGRSRIALYSIARFARCDVRWEAAVFVGADGRKSAVPPSPPAHRRREHRGNPTMSSLFANTSRYKAAQAARVFAHRSSIRRRAIPDAHARQAVAT